jgi:hypothetical protein
MHFHAGEISHFEHFGQQRADVLNYERSTFFACPPPRRVLTSSGHAEENVSGSGTKMEVTRKPDRSLKHREL